MKNTRLTKLTAFLIISVLIVSMAAVFTTSAVTADGITETASISQVNVEHRDFMHLAFIVETEGEHTGTVGIMIWEADVTDYTAANAIYSNYETSEDSAGNVYYSGHAIAAKNIATEYMVAVVEKDAQGEVTVISVPELHSIEGWAEQKLTESPDTVRENLYNKVIAYGKAASAILNK